MSLRTSTTILENAATQAGLPLHRVLEGDASAAKNALAGLVAKDASGNFQYLLQTPAGLAVTLAGGIVCRSKRGKVSGSATYVAVATLVLTNGKSYQDLDWSVACYRDAAYEIVYIQDVGGTPTETIFVDILVGQGAITHSGELTCEKFTVPGTLVHHLVLRAKNENGLSDLRGSFSIGEIV